MFAVRRPVLLLQTKLVAAVGVSPPAFTGNLTTSVASCAPNCPTPTASLQARGTGREAAACCLLSLLLLGQEQRSFGGAGCRMPAAAHWSRATSRRMLRPAHGALTTACSCSLHQQGSPALTDPCPGATGGNVVFDASLTVDPSMRPLDNLTWALTGGSDNTLAALVADVNALPVRCGWHHAPAAAALGSPPPRHRPALLPPRTQLTAIVAPARPPARRQRMRMRFPMANVSAIAPTASGASYTLTITATNVFGMVSTASTSFTKASAATTPTLAIDQVRGLMGGGQGGRGRG